MHKLIVSHVDIRANIEIRMMCSCNVLVFVNIICPCVFVVDVTVSYQFHPTVAHTQRLTITIDKIDDVNVVAAATNGLTAEPGESTSFSISVMNTGNAPSQYQVDCVSEHRWQLMEFYMKQ